MRRNADEDLRELERIATETRAQADIVRYESAATRVGIRRLVSVNDLVEPRRIPKTEGGIYLGHPTQVARVIEVEVLRPRTDPGEPGLSGLGFGASGLGLTFFVESRAPWAGAPRGEDPAFVFDGLWGRAVDPPRFHHWPVPFGRDRGLWPTEYGPGPAEHGQHEWTARIATVPVSIPADWRRLLVTHVYAWTRLPPWASEVPRVLRTSTVTGHMTGFLTGDPVADPRRRHNSDGDKDEDGIEAVEDVGEAALTLAELARCSRTLAHVTGRPRSFSSSSSPRSRLKICSRTLTRLASHFMMPTLRSFSPRRSRRAKT